MKTIEVTCLFCNQTYKVTMDEEVEAEIKHCVLCGDEDIEQEEQDDED